MRLQQDDKGAVRKVCKIKVQVHAEVITQEEMHLRSRTDLIYTSGREHFNAPGVYQQLFLFIRLLRAISFWVPLCRDKHKIKFACISLLPLFSASLETMLELEVMAKF